MAMTASGNEAAETAGIAGDTVSDQISAEVTLPAAPFGEWPSPITAADVASARVEVSYPIVVGSEVWWQQVLAEESGRTTVMHSSGGKPTMLLPEPWNARTRVHEYGGLSYLPVPRAALRAQGLGGRGHLIVFANFADQRLYLTLPAAKSAARVEEGQDGPRPLTPDPGSVPAGSGTGTLAAGALRYADFTLSPDRAEIWCVQERHDNGKVSRAIVGVPLDGSAAENPDAIRTLVSGADFFAYPTPSPDGRWLAWICWNHPHMPWDGTELRVAPVENGVPGRGRPVMGGQRESVLAPLWRDNASLYVSSSAG